MAKNVNYTDQEVDKLKALYIELGNEGLEDIAKELGKTERSVRAKLSSEGVYIKSTKKEERYKEPSKKELLRDIEAFGFETKGFEPATKEALFKLLHLVQNKGQ